MNTPAHPAEGVLVMDGIVVAGTRPGCGKTAALTGIAGAMVQNGLRISAIKPLEFFKSPPPVCDQAFMTAILRPMQQPDSVMVQDYTAVNTVEWNRVLHYCRKLIHPALIECPGSISSPLAIVHDKILSGLDLATSLGTPVLLVTPYSADLLGDMVPVLETLLGNFINVMGWVAVERTENPYNAAPHWQREVLWLTEKYQIPYLGSFGYSAGINVRAGRAGNLITQAENQIDLLPIQMVLNRVIPAGEDPVRTPKALPPLRGPLV